MKKLSILIVDGEFIFLHNLREYLLNDNSISNVATTSNPLEALDLLIIEKFDYIICQININFLNGFEFVSKVRKFSETPIILTDIYGSYDQVISKLDNVVFVKRPTFDVNYPINELDNYLIKIKSHLYQIEDDSVVMNQLIAIGASAGGTEAINEIISDLPAITPPIIICQHLPKEFSYMFATRLNYKSKLSCKVGKNNELLLPCQVYICEGNAITTVKKTLNGYVLKVTNIIEDIHPLPNINCLFESLAVLPVDIIAVILTGMGEDGAKGVGQIKDKGGFTIAQDEETSLVYGMPLEAIKTGKIDEVLPIQKIAGRIIDKIKRREEK
jgi:two-component system chemotaxis response regulator CheB